MVCACSRCAREPEDEKFHSSDAHQMDANERHWQIRGRAADWRAPGLLGSFGNASRAVERREIEFEEELERFLTGETNGVPVTSDESRPVVRPSIQGMHANAVVCRIAALRAAGEAARPRVAWRVDGSKRRFWLQVRRANGSIEDLHKHENDREVIFLTGESPRNARSQAMRVMAWVWRRFLGELDTAHEYELLAQNIENDWPTDLRGY